MRRTKLAVPLRCLGLLLIGGPLYPLPALEYEVNGVIDQDTYWGGGRGIQLHEESSFTVFVRNGQWVIRILPEDSRVTPVVMREFGSPNGTEFYDLEIPLRMAGTNAAGGTNSAAASRKGPSRPARQVLPPKTLIIRSNSVPVDADWGVMGHLWLMFVSQAYFKNLRTNLLTPVFDVNASEGYKPDLELRAEWELMGGLGQLPLKVVYYNGGGFYHMDMKGEVLFTRYPPPYSNGFTQAIYQVTGVTQAGAVTVPSGFVFEEFVPGGKRRSKDDLALRRRAEAVVSAVRPICSRRSLLPACSGETVVDDRRLTRAQPPVRSLLYTTHKRNWWPSVAKSLKAYEECRHPKKASPVLLMLLLAATLAPVVLIWRGRPQTRGGKVE